MTKAINPMLEKVARAISGQDEAGWAALPADDRERLYGGGKWHDSGHTRADYLDDARAVVQALLEPDEAMLNAPGVEIGWYRQIYQAMLQTILEEQ